MSAHDCCSGHHEKVAPAASAKYFCPMCPGVESEKPGACPKCGMALETKVITAAEPEDDGELRDMTRHLWSGALCAQIGRAHV